MAKRRAPAITAEELERLRLLAADERRERCAAAARALQPLAQDWLAKQGGNWVSVLARYRHAIVQASAPAYRPTVRQLMARPVDGIEVEVEF